MKYFIYSGLGLILGVVLSIMFALAVDIETENKLSDKNAIIKEQQNLISSYVKKIKEDCPECNCEDQYKWLIDFYDEFHEEVGAYE